MSLETSLLAVRVSGVLIRVCIAPCEWFSTGESDRPPCKVGVAATDIATGLYAHGAIMAALLSRQNTGKGAWIDCNLFETQVGPNSSLRHIVIRFLTKLLCGVWWC